MYAETNANYFNNTQSFQFEVEGPKIQHSASFKKKWELNLSDTDTNIDSTIQTPPQITGKYEVISQKS